MNCHKVILVFLLSFYWILNAGEVKLPKGLVNLLFLPEMPGTVLVIEKKTQKAFVYKVESDSLDLNLIKEFAVSTGKNNGNKFKKDDLKTPEGFYLIKEYIPSEKLALEFGIGAFPLDYPNSIDKLLKKSGHSIWIHGLNKERVPYDTKGCIALENEDFLFLKEHITIGKTPLLITGNLHLEDKEKIIREADTLLEIIKNWEKKWETNDIESYLDFYHPDFYSSDKKMNFDKWSEYKKRISQQTEFISLDFSNTEYFYSDNYFLVKFNQRFTSDKFSDFGKKTLLWKNEHNNWYILQEDWHYIKDKDKEIQLVKNELEFSEIIKNWENLWENKKIDSYLKCYHPDFYSSDKDMDFDEWTDYKKRITNESDSIAIDLSDIEYFYSNGYLFVKFHQRYTSEKYSDSGNKTLLWKKNNNKWQIVRENWYNIEDQDKKK